MKGVDGIDWDEVDRVNRVEVEGVEGVGGVEVTIVFAEIFRQTLTRCDIVSLPKKTLLVAPRLSSKDHF